MTNKKNNSEIIHSTRREFLRCAGCTLPILTATSKAWSLDSEKLESEPAKNLPPQPGDRLTYYAKSKRGKILSVHDIPLAGKQIMVIPIDSSTGLVRDGSRYNLIMLQRFAASELSEDTLSRSAQGLVAYSAICTHTGCVVTSWDREQQAYMCPCHQSVYDPRKSAEIVSGPAPRPLPSLPLRMENQEIVVSGHFNNAVGFGKHKG